MPWIMTWLPRFILPHARRIGFTSSCALIRRMRRWLYSILKLLSFFRILYASIAAVEWSCVWFTGDQPYNLNGVTQLEMVWNNNEKSDHRVIIETKPWVSFHTQFKCFVREIIQTCVTWLNVGILFHTDPVLLWPNFPLAEFLHQKNVQLWCAAA